MIKFVQVRRKKFDVLELFFRVCILTSLLTQCIRAESRCQRESYQVLQPLEYLARVVVYRGLIVLQRSPLRLQQCWQRSYNRHPIIEEHINIASTVLLSTKREVHTHTSRDLLHEYLEDSVLAGWAQVAHDVLVTESRVERDLLVQRLHLTVNKPNNYTIWLTTDSYFQSRSI